MFFNGGENMSRIITHEKCDCCGKEFKNFYISFGHPDHDITWKWKCHKCGSINERLIKAWKVPDDLGWINLKDLEEG